MGNRSLQAAEKTKEQAWKWQDLKYTEVRMILRFVAVLSMKKLGLLLSCEGHCGPMAVDVSVSFSVWASKRER